MAFRSLSLWVLLLPCLTVAACEESPDPFGSPDDSTDPDGDDGDTNGDAADDDDTDDGSDSTGDDGTDEPPTGTGCDGTVLLESPVDFAERGPWPVGARTVTLDGLTVEVWYPAELGSESGVGNKVYDVRLALPVADQAKIPDEDNPWQECECYPDLPIDAAHGPYPLVVFVHGTAAFRTQSLEQMQHWASRGFVVMSADHPGLWLADMLTFNTGVQDLAGDIDTMLTAAENPSGELEFLAGRLRTDLVGMAGHSAGGGAIRGRGGDADVLMPLASGGADAGAALQSVLVMGAQDDGVAAYTGQVSGYESSPAPKRFVGIAQAGHLVFSDLCALLNDEGQDLIEIATEYGVTNVSLATFLWDGCGEGYVAPADAFPIVNHATSAVLEETLHCKAVDANLGDISGRYDLVAEYREAL